MSEGAFAVNVRLELKPEFRDEFVHAIQTNAEATRTSESGALQFVVGQQADDPNVFHLHEQYKSLADFDAHESTPHFKAFFDFIQTKDALAAPLVLEKYQCQHEPVVIPVRSAFCLNIESAIKAEFREEFLTLMTSHQSNSQAEPGCLQFDWGENIETANTFHLHEQYQDRAAFEAHTKTPHFEKFGVFNAKDPYSKPQVLSFFNTI